VNRRKFAFERFKNKMRGIKATEEELEEKFLSKKLRVRRKAKAYEMAIRNQRRELGLSN
jgi:hypothetical protein